MNMNLIKMRRIIKDFIDGITVNFMAIRSTWLSGFKICLNPKIKKENGYPVFKFFPKYLKFHSIPHSF